MNPSAYDGHVWQIVVPFITQTPQHKTKAEGEILPSRAETRHCKTTTSKLQPIQMVHIRVDSTNHPLCACLLDRPCTACCTHTVGGGLTIAPTAVMASGVRGVVVDSRGAVLGLAMCAANGRVVVRVEGDKWQQHGRPLVAIAAPLA